MSGYSTMRSRATQRRVYALTTTAGDPVYLSTLCVDHYANDGCRQAALIEAIDEPEMADWWDGDIRFRNHARHADEHNLECIFCAPIQLPCEVAP